MLVPSHKLDRLCFDLFIFFVFYSVKVKWNGLPTREKQAERNSLCILIGFMGKVCGHAMFTEPEADF